MENYSLRLWQLKLTQLVLTVALVEAVQHFQEEPRDSNVIRGQTAVLKCVIGDRKGAVQWTKDGFSLGFNRTIPGLDRYSITSSHENEFNLMIVNASLDDDAVYECQVLPKDGDSRLQARATLTVLVPCEAPMILDYMNGSTVEVPYTQKTLELSCEARDGRPAASIEWFRNGVKMTDKIRYRIESRANDKRETARSTLTISLTNYQAENGAIYKCQARNSAVFGPPLTTSVVLSILFPPSPPLISGYDNRIINVNETLVLTCSSEGGNPLGSVTWYRNNQVLQHNHSTFGIKSTNVYTFRVSSSDNNAVYQCRVSNHVLQEPLVAEYLLKVQFPPTSVKITGADEPVKAGDTITLTCESSNSNPQATIIWYAKSSEVPRNDVTETYIDSPEGGKITRSRISVTVNNKDHETVYTCRASNAAFGQTVTDTKTLSVLYPPNEPEISGYEGGTPIKAGDLQRMTCISVGGNPPADLKWFKGDKLIRESDYKSRINIASSEIAINVKADDNKATYTCRAGNRATLTDLEVSVTLKVNFPPSQVEISVNPSQPQAGQPLNLTCISSSSNPPAEIVWVRNGRRVTSEHLGTVDAENGGKKSTNRYSFIPTSRDHNALYGCRATNRALDRSVNDAVTLNVLFKPEFDNETLPPKVDVKKGDGAILNLTAYANPADITYILYKDGQLLNLPSRYRMNKGVLNISSVEKTDKGNYMIKGTNQQGSATFNFSINVKYPAEIINSTNRLSLNEGETAILSCRVDASPIIPNVITWGRENFDMNRAQARLEGDTSYLSISDLTSEDSGTFKCIADNRIGSPDVKKVKLLVKFAPVIQKDPEISRSAGEKGSTVSLKCSSKGVPDVTVTWTRNNNLLRASSKYTIVTNNTNLTHYESTLQIKDLEREDYGAYVCTATNSKGSDSHSITLAGTSKPLPPYNIEFNNATSNSITISWKAGFNGGLTQSFRVRYKPVDARGYVYVDVRPFGATTFKIKGLELGTEYEMTVMAFNDRGESIYQPRGITARTSDIVAPADISTSELQGADEIPVIIILVVCIVGVFILTLNVGLILFFIRRRKKRMEATSESTSHTNTFELYGPTSKSENSYPPPSDDTRSYGTYDKSMDDFSDDYIRDYDRECETHVFLPQQSDYPGSRPYSPQKIESPRMGSGHKMAYSLEDHHGRNSPWNEDLYRVAQPRQKKGNYENGMPNGEIYEFKNNRSKGFNESDRPPSRPSSRSGKTPPPPPTRSSSRGGFNNGEMMPPLPARNYEPQEISPQPRYGPTPGSSLLSPNIVANPSYSGPTTNINQRIPSPHAPSPHNTVPIGADLRGHLV
ncbi:unnamed protein product [Lymnaea stagnalis]|uniref:Nephrin n=1 Tax=Lymnaea stagnalis TaxID=6523 RepID=A0AAV2HDT8_LYMST